MSTIRPTALSQPAEGWDGPAVRLRAMREGDLDAALAIEVTFQAGAWTREVFQHWLARRNVHGVVAAGEEGLYGYFLAAAEEGYLHLLNIAVAREQRRRGLGTLLLRAVEEIARKRRLARVELEVHETNLGAQLLYKKLGYVAVLILRAHYGEEDGYRMQKELAG